MAVAGTIKKAKLAAAMERRLERGLLRMSGRLFTKPLLVIM